MRARPATPADAETVARIYNAGIEERIATFETRLRRLDEVLPLLDGAYPTVVVVSGGAVIAFATTSAHSPRECSPAGSSLRSSRTLRLRLRFQHASLSACQHFSFSMAYGRGIVRGTTMVRVCTAYTIDVRGVKKENLPEKTCPACGRPFRWRKKWERDWESVVYCSDRCKKARSG